MQPGLCQHRKTPTATCREGARCLQPCDAYGHHALDCMTGGARVTLHDAGYTVIHQVRRAGGMRAQREVLAPDLATPKLTQPRVDVDAWGHPGLPHLRLDFTAVSPSAVRSRRVKRRPTQAAEQAEKDKANKYGCRPGGVGVDGVAMELSGRHGPNLDTLLRKLAGYARADATAKSTEAQRHLQHWRIALSVALARFSHAAIYAVAAGQCRSTQHLQVSATTT